MTSKAQHPSSRSRYWLRARKLAQAGVFVVLLVFLAGAPRQAASSAAASVLLRLDPLAGLAAWLAGGTALPGSASPGIGRVPGLVWVVVALLAALVLGRSWCGWICPLGTLLDWITPRTPARLLLKRTQSLQGWRKVKYLLLSATLGMALLGFGGAALDYFYPSGPRGTLPLLAFDPLSIFVRAAAGFWPAMNALVTSLLTALYNGLPPLRPAVSTLDSWLRPLLLPYEFVYAKDALWAVLLLLAVVALNWVVPRFWCRYLCPLGGLLGLVSKSALLRRQVDAEDCTGCQVCARRCPTGTIDPERGYASDPAECTLCLECLPACPRGDTSFRFSNPLAPGSFLLRPYDPERRQVLATFGAGVAAAALLAADLPGSPAQPGPLRPPGSLEAALLSRCMRCGLCLRTCPTGALQPAIGEAGIEGIWTPIVLPRLGYCDYACHACGIACPEAAIPALSLEEKRQQVIGKAYIDEGRCLAWADQTPCIVCEEMCPLPEKAIWLEDSVVSMPGGSVALQLPHVDRQRCIGCGICEYKCPLNGEAAIQVKVS